ncbi:hypothetical protein TNCV_525531 [Trichonephila clavipes]|nr:hypothetical protein TNCV_525531 [Trichonephila clavipes]
MVEVEIDGVAIYRKEFHPVSQALAICIPSLRKGHDNNTRTTDLKILNHFQMTRMIPEMAMMPEVSVESFYSVLAEIDGQGTRKNLGDISNTPIQSEVHGARTPCANRNSRSIAK